VAIRQQLRSLPVPSVSFYIWTSGGNMAEVTYASDRFRLDVRERRLWRDDELVPLRDKVFDTLVLLVEGAGSLQTQQELIDRLWPDVSVEPNNLQHNISILRKALAGSSVQIETLRGRGYRLVAEVIRAPTPQPDSSTKQITRRCSRRPS
jgi:DNA-binding winged helix-turn-helix (wHTH) protein